MTSSGQSGEKSALKSLGTNQIRELEKIAIEIYDAILARNTSTILKFIDRKGGIRWGPDGSKTYREVEKDLRSGKGELYCLLFGCPSSRRKAVREFFSEVKRTDLRIEIRPVESDASNDQYVEVIYNWSGKAPDLSVADLPNPIFVLRGGGWKFESVFME